MQKSKDEIFAPYEQSIGKIATMWASFEFAVNDHIWELANVGRSMGACMTAQFIGPGPRFRCLVALMNLRQVPQSFIKKMNSLSSEADSLSRQRNRYLHDPHGR